MDVGSGIVEFLLVLLLVLIVTWALGNTGIMLVRDVKVWRFQAKTRKASKVAAAAEYIPHTDEW